MPEVSKGLRSERTTPSASFDFARWARSKRSEALRPLRRPILWGLGFRV